MKISVIAEYVFAYAGSENDERLVRFSVTTDNKDPIFYSSEIISGSFLTTFRGRPLHTDTAARQNIKEWKDVPVEETKKVTEY